MTRILHTILPDIDECEVYIDGCDQDCINTPGSFLCNCSQGFVLNEYGFTCDGEMYGFYIIVMGSQDNLIACVDLDECLSDPCHSNATCNNTIGSFTCTCVSGYSGDGFLCSGKQRCVSQCCLY